MAFLIYLKICISFLVFLGINLSAVSLAILLFKTSYKFLSLTKQSF